MMDMNEGLKRGTVLRECFLVMVEPPVEEFLDVVGDMQLNFIS